MPHHLPQTVHLSQQRPRPTWTEATKRKATHKPLLLLTLLDLVKRGEIKPLIAQRLPLAEARRAHEMLGEGGVLGKIVLLPNV